MKMKKLAGAAAIAGAVGAAGLGLGAGSAQADDGWGPWVPWDPGHWVGDWGHGWIPDGPPGLVKNAWCPWNPPGQWDGGPHGHPCH